MALNRKQTIKRVIFVVIITHIGLGLWFVERGLLNADEGWYLYAARQMAHGLEPYRDFAFLQGPVYPRVLSGLIDAGPGSLLAGRWLSWLMLLMATCTTGLAAMRISGLGGAMIATVCVGLNPLVMATAVLVKPYALAMLLLAGGLFLLAARDRLRVCVGFWLIGLAVGTRVSLLLPLLVLIWAHRHTRLREATIGSAIGIGLALYPSLGVPLEVLWENWVGFHLSDGGGLLPRIQWLGWQAGLCGFFLVGGLFDREGRIPGLRAAAAAGLLVHLAPSELHVEHAVLVMPLMGLAVADSWGELISPKVIGLGTVLVGLSIGVGMRWVHLDRQTRTVEQVAELGRWVAERTEPGLPLLTPHLAVAVEADRAVCAGFEMGQFGWEPEMSPSRASVLHRLHPAGLMNCLNGAVGGILIADHDLDLAHRDTVLRAARSRFTVHRTVRSYGQFSERLDIFVPGEGLLWTE